MRHWSSTTPPSTISQTQLCQRGWTPPEQGWPAQQLPWQLQACCLGVWLGCLQASTLPQ